MHEWSLYGVVGLLGALVPGALLRGLDIVIQNATGLEVKVADDPLTCVARGTAAFLENLDQWKDTLESDMDV